MRFKNQKNLKKSQNRKRRINRELKNKKKCNRMKIGKNCLKR